MLCCVAVVLCGALQRAALCWVMSWWGHVVASGCGLWWCIRCASWCGVAVRRGVSCFVLVLGGFHGLGPFSCCFAVLCVSVCSYWVACFVVSGFVCCVRLVLGFVSLCYVAWWRVLWRFVVARCLEVCYVLLFCCCCFRWGLLGCCSAALFCCSFCGPFRCFPLLCGLLLACFVSMLVARHCCDLWRGVACCCVLS